MTRPFSRPTDFADRSFQCKEVTLMSLYGGWQVSAGMSTKHAWKAVLERGSDKCQRNFFPKSLVYKNRGVYWGSETTQSSQVCSVDLSFINFSLKWGIEGCAQVLWEDSKSHIDSWLQPPAPYPKACRMIFHPLNIKWIKLYDAVYAKKKKWHLHGHCSGKSTYAKEQSNETWKMFLWTIPSPIGKPPLNHHSLSIV